MKRNPIAGSTRNFLTYFGEFWTVLVNESGDKLYFCDEKLGFELLQSTSWLIRKHGTYVEWYISDKVIKDYQRVACKISAYSQYFVRMEEVGIFEQLRIIFSSPSQVQYCTL
jgi:hypothetical protein